MSDAVRDTETLLDAARQNEEGPLREGSLLVFPDYGQVVMTGDLHGNLKNLAKIQKFCDLEHAGARHVVLHEIIHEDPETYGAPDLSHRALVEAARWKCDYPDQVHFVQSNHELAQLNHHEITKNGRVVTADFEAGVRQTYGSDAERVLEGIQVFIRSHPLAARTANRVFLAHSIPGPRMLPAFDPRMFERVPTDADLGDNGSAYLLVWGRYQTPSSLEAFAEMMDVDLFVCGHQPQDMGYDVLHERMVILASDHNHGVLLPFDLSKPMTVDRLVQSVRHLAGVA